MNFIEEKFNEWVTKRFPETTPRRAFIILSIMFVLIVTDLAYTYYKLSTIAGSKNALIVMVIVAGIVFMFYQALSKKIVQKAPEQGDLEE